MSNRFSRIVAVTCVVGLAVTGAGPAHAVDLGPTRLVSADAEGVQANGDTHEAVVSASGRFIAIGSAATNLVPDDTNGVDDVFVTDSSDGSVERVSVDEEGDQLSSGTFPLSMSSDGRYVLFASTHDGTSLRLADRDTGTSRRIEKRARNGNWIRFHAAQLTGNARYLVFFTGRPLVRSDKDGLNDVYRLELATGALRRVTPPSLDARSTAWRSYGFSVSHSGRIVELRTTARLLRRDRRGSGNDVYVRDMRDRRPRLVSVSTSGRQAGARIMDAKVSANGRYVVFAAWAGNLVRRDNNHQQDVFVRDLRAGTTKLVSVSSRERQGDAHSGGASISDNGRFVVFRSSADNLAPGTTDFDEPRWDDSGNVFVRDRSAGTTTAVSMAPDGTGADATSWGFISPDGSTIVIGSSASNLVEGVSGRHVFARRLTVGRG